MDIFEYAERSGKAIARLEIARIELNATLKFNSNDAKALVEDIQKTIDGISEALKELDNRA
jgi:hypothetical protein